MLCPFLLFSEKLKRVLRSKSRLDYSYTSSGTYMRMVRGEQWLNIVTPGNAGNIGTISIQTVDGRWLFQDNIYLRFKLFENSSSFSKLTTFLLHHNQSISNNLVAIESFAKRGYFIMGHGNIATLRFQSYYKHNYQKEYFKLMLNDKGKYMISQCRSFNAIWTWGPLEGFC